MQALQLDLQRALHKMETMKKLLFFQEFFFWNFKTEFHLTFLCGNVFQVIFFEKYIVIDLKVSIITWKKKKILETVYLK